jgi:glutamine synthetase
MHFSTLCGIDDKERENAIQACLKKIDEWEIEQVRFSWCDIHGTTRTKTLMLEFARQALRSGVGMVSTLLLKDSSDRTAFQVFEPGGTHGMQGIGQGNNVTLLPDPKTIKRLPWASKTAWIQCQAWFQNGTPVPMDSRRILERALSTLKSHGYAMKCGLEVEFHIYKITDQSTQLNPHLAPWPGSAPGVQLIHPGYSLLSEAWSDLCNEPMGIVQHTAQGLGLPLISLETELGPSQVEAVFSPSPALEAADNMVLFRNGVKQALARAGYHATFMCRPPFDSIMSSGWHLHQSLIELQNHTNAFERTSLKADAGPLDAQYSLSDIGEYYLAGLLEHAKDTTLLCTPTINGYARFKPNALAPELILWGRDNRGAMLRVIGEQMDPSSRIENRLGEPAANPYLYMASQIYAGLEGILHEQKAPLATLSPYSKEVEHSTLVERIPNTFKLALNLFEHSAFMRQSFGEDFVRYYSTLKHSELKRYESALDPQQFETQEYFSRI